VILPLVLVLLIAAAVRSPIQGQEALAAMYQPMAAHHQVKETVALVL
jgi:hypothetical protein